MFYWKRFSEIEQLSQELFMLELFMLISKQQQMMTQPMASVKFIKAKVIFSYHTKGVSNQI